MCVCQVPLVLRNMTNIKILFKSPQIKEEAARKAEVKRLRAIQLKEEAREKKARQEQLKLVQKEKREKAALEKKKMIEVAAQQALDLFDATPDSAPDIDVHEDRRVTRQQASKKYRQEGGKEVKTHKYTWMQT